MRVYYDWTTSRVGFINIFVLLSNGLSSISSFFRFVILLLLLKDKIFEVGTDADTAHTLQDERGSSLRSDVIDRAF